MEISFTAYWYKGKNLLKVESKGGKQFKKVDQKLRHYK